jgi:hypothetical protein
MKKYLTILVLLGALAYTVAGIATGEPGQSEPRNCFKAVVHNSQGNPVSGATVRLTPPVGLSELCITGEEGICRFCRHPGEWDPGWYTISTHCCEEHRYRSGDGTIIVDFTIPCQCQ